MNIRKQLVRLRGKLYRQFYRNRRGFHHQGRLVPFIDPQAGNDLLSHAIRRRSSLMVARHGSNELNFVVRPRLSTFQELCGIAGFFPKDMSLGKEFVTLYRAASSDVDLLAIWNFRHGKFKEEERLFNLCGPDAATIDLISLTPFHYKNPWTRVLAGKSVLVVHPFVATIQRQYHESRTKLFQDPEVLPEFKSLQCVRAVQSMDGKVKGYATWFDALDSMCREIESKDFDIALIGCGAYGLPLASFVKGIGKQAIHIGGALQLFFGIKGRRWEGEASGYNYDRKYYNDYWVRPDETETPKDAHKYEGSAYW